jgi:hypothetical protein
MDSDDEENAGSDKCGPGRNGPKDSPLRWFEELCRDSPHASNHNQKEPDFGNRDAGVMA